MNERKRFEREMGRIMVHIITTGSLPSLDAFGRECIYYCREQGYVGGLKAARMAGQNIVIDISAPRVTPKGLEWLHPKHDTKFIVSLAVALAELVVIVLQTILTA